jgi:AP-1-like factor
MDSLQPKDQPVEHPRLTLSARQEQLLFAALNSNGNLVNNNPTIETSNPRNTNSFTMAPSSFSESPLQAPGSGTINGLDSPSIDYDYEFDADGSFNYDFSNSSLDQMIGKLPGPSSDGDVETHDKRGHEDDDDGDEGGGKRREGDEKQSKKPGRKPLTSEPTSKRKAQNRAAQRAFRERKEKHLKDLETKVEDLQKASEEANHENSKLRAQIERMTMELQGYRKRLSLTGNARSVSNPSANLPSYLSGKGLGNGLVNHPQDVSFQFEFPKFGRLPGPPLSTTATNGNGLTASPVTTTGHMPSPIEKGQASPRNQSLQFSQGSTSSSISMNPAQAQNDLGDMASLSGLFSPTLLDSVNKSPAFDFFGNNNSNSSVSRSSTDSASGNMSTGHNTSYSSPSASSNSNQGTSSSCGTSPEPTTLQSPNYNKSVDTMAPIGEEHHTGASGEGEELTFCDKLNMACGNPSNPIPRTMSEHSVYSGNFDNPALDINGIDWFAQQNGGQFDPQLFGEYREPQDNVLFGDNLNDTFFSDAFSIPDFNSPYNADASVAPTKKDLISQIDKTQDDEDEVVPGEDKSSMLSCNTIWDRLQACPKVKEGEFDLDLLCKDLQKKAKCSETGAVVNESDFNKIMKNYIKDGANQGKNKA